MNKMKIAAFAVVVAAALAVPDVQGQTADFDGSAGPASFSSFAAAGGFAVPGADLVVPAAGGLLQWSSDLGAVWTCANGPSSKAECREWKSDKGSSWSCGRESSGGECLSWVPNKELPMTSSDASAGTNFPPIFLQRSVSLPSRKVRLEKSSPSWDENGMGWVACSEKDQAWQSTENTWRTERKEKWEIYVCRYIVTYNCRWKNCTRPYPNTDPNSCSCKVSCRNSAEKTNDCHWEQIQTK